MILLLSPCVFTWWGPNMSEQAFFMLNEATCQARSHHLVRVQFNWACLSSNWISGVVIATGSCNIYRHSKPLSKKSKAHEPSLHNHARWRSYRTRLPPLLLDTKPTSWCKVQSICCSSRRWSSAICYALKYLMCRHASESLKKTFEYHEDSSWFSKWKLPSSCPYMHTTMVWSVWGLGKIAHYCTCGTKSQQEKQPNTSSYEIGFIGEPFARYWYEIYSHDYWNPLFPNLCTFHFVLIHVIGIHIVMGELKMLLPHVGHLPKIKKPHEFKFRVSFIQSR